MISAARPPTRDALAHCLVVFAILGGFLLSQARAQSGIRSRVEAAAGQSHPYLFFSEHAAETVRATATATPLLRKVYRTIEEEAQRLRSVAPRERTMRGKRLLGTSRDVLRRVIMLAFMHRVTGEVEYAQRAERELLSAAAFSDWNPSHFLDVGEMTAALAIGYDWLYPELDQQARRQIRRAIVEKGLEPSFRGDRGWIESANNWNQVNHGGLVLGALAVLNEEPTLAARVVKRAVDHVQIPMHENYGPNGGYAEGPSYWYYGTHYNVLLIDALQSALGTGFGLTSIRPFMRSASFYVHAHAPSLQYYNYSDSDLSAAVAPALYWFARTLNKPQLLWMETRKLKRMSPSPPPDAPARTDEAFRFLPLLLVWAEPSQMHPSPQPDATHFSDTAPLAVGIHRSAWDDRATFVGIEGGAARQSHGQMDAGSFVVEAKGVRWAHDLPKQSYLELEQAGVQLWDSSPGGERWDVFRLNNYSHNTLVVNGRHQRVNGFASVVKHGADGPAPHTVLYLSPVYAGQLARARRGIRVLDEGRVVQVQDEVVAPADTSAEIRWGMVTNADVQVGSDTTALLEQDGKTLRVEVEAPADARLQTFSMTPPAEYNAANPGTRMLGFKTVVPPSQARRWVVTLIIEGPHRRIDIDPLVDW